MGIFLIFLFNLLKEGQKIVIDESYSTISTLCGGANINRSKPLRSARGYLPFLHLRGAYITFLGETKAYWRVIFMRYFLPIT